MAEIKERVTLQNIAEMAGISRNTVSKILNGRYNGSPRIREHVLSLIRECNYKGMAQFAGTAEEKEIKTILLLCKEGAVMSSFFPYLVNEVQKNVEGKGYLLQFYGITEVELQAKKVPEVVLKHQVDGIICMEIFHKEYIEKIICCQIPTVFLEFCHDMWGISGKYDIVLMNNEYPVYVLTNELIAKGCRNIGFVGDYTHCRGFYERYQGYLNALRENRISPNRHICLTFADGAGYHDKRELWRRLKGMNCMPDAFVAANDSIAIALMQTLQEWGFHIPEDIKLVSFDNSAAASAVKPALTTVHSDGEALGRSVVECLLQRMENPERLRNVIYVETEIIYRETFR